MQVSPWEKASTTLGVMYYHTAHIATEASPILSLVISWNKMVISNLLESAVNSI